jgi:hypothetical protein
VTLLGVRGIGGHVAGDHGVCFRVEGAISGEGGTAIASDEKQS